MNRHILIAFGASLGMGVAFLNLTPVLPVLQSTYRASNARMGMLVTVLLFSHSLVQVPSGIVVDRFGVRTGVLAALGLGFLGNVFSLFSQDYYFLLAMRFLTGIGTGLSFVAGLKYATFHARAEQKMQVQAVFGGLINIGSTLPFFVSPILSEYDVRLIYLLTAFFFFLPMLAVLLWGQDPKKKERVSKPPLSQVLFSRTAWALGFSHAVFFGGMMTIGTWISAYIHTYATGSAGLSWMGLIGGLVISVSAAGRFLGAFTPHWIRPRDLILGALVFLGLAYGGLSISQSLVPGLALMGLAALMNSVTFGSVFYLTYQASAPQIAGTAIGLVNFIASIGAFVFPIIFGYLIDVSGTFEFPFLFLAALAFSSLYFFVTFSTEAVRSAVRP